MTESNHTNPTGGWVWIASAAALLTYAALIMSSTKVPGIEQMVAWLDSIDPRYIFITAFLVMFIEGLYFVGGFFPGSSSVVVLAIISGSNDFSTFLITIASIFLGWSVAGAVNIFFAARVRAMAKPETENTDTVQDHLFTTWFPAFRANFEVAEVTDGKPAWAVFYSAVRVKFLVSLAMLVVTYIASFIIDLEAIDNEEGVGVLIVVAVICLFVGTRKLRGSKTT